MVLHWDMVILMGLDEVMIILDKYEVAEKTKSDYCLQRGMCKYKMLFYDAVISSDH